LLYWYKSTNTDAATAEIRGALELILSVYLLYWYKSTNTDAATAEIRGALELILKTPLNTSR
jgi:hypothetical protein